MKLTGTNRRRDLKRRRKLMPEPRRINMTTSTTTDAKVISETPSALIRNQNRVDLDRVVDSTSEQTVAQNQA